MNQTLRKKTRAVALGLTLLALQVGLTGCFGRFALTRKVYGLNQSINDKWLRTIATFVLVVAPVYGACAFVDWALFNTIEFWGGRNPIDGVNSDLPPPAPPANLTAQGGRAVDAQLSPDGRELRVELEHPGALPRILTLQLREGGASLRDGDGRLIATLSIDAAGDSLVRDAGGRLLDERGAAGREQLERAVASGDRALLGASAAALEARGARVARR